MSSNFEKVREFHEVFEHPVYTKPQKNIFDENPELVDLRLKLIQEEVSELETAIHEKNFKEVADALSDILYVVYGAGHAFGIDLDKTFDLVHKSNMTKACVNEEEAKETCEIHMNRYNPGYKLSEDKKRYIVYDKDTKKILKSKYYEEVKLDF